MAASGDRMTPVPASAPPQLPCSVRILSARSTTKQWTVGNGRQQIVQATVSNDGSQWIDFHRPLTVRVVVNGARTAAPGRIDELGPGERAPVQIGITSAGVPNGSQAQGRIVAAFAGGCSASLPVRLTLGVPQYTADPASLRTHEAPDWFDAAKFGIFIHWGAYSVPAWAPVGTYAEWYWNAMHKRGSPTYRRQLALHGKLSRYDQFIPQFRAQRFDPKAWVDLFHAAGARYFVLTSKHHEGFALFRTATTHRNAVEMGPHRDLVGALFAAARRYHPADLHPGLYYSLYEWYNPAYTDHPVPQYYTGKPIAYTGYKPIRSYVDDHMLVQMREIVDGYHPQILWCDGEWEKPPAYWHDAGAIAHFYNQALAAGAGVAIDDRCRVDGAEEREQTVYDFSTPEYRTYGTTVAKKWEASRGMGYSYGYNANEQPKDYKTAGELVRMLVDMVSKNGNLLLDIGPKADGTIPAIMQQRLRAIGAWLRVNGQAIYGSHYWWRTPAEGSLRFTVQPNRAFYIISLARPPATLTVRAPVPIAPGDTITLLGYDAGTLRWHKHAGSLIVDVPPAARRSGAYAWTFKVAW